MGSRCRAKPLFEAWQTKAQPLSIREVPRVLFNMKLTPVLVVLFDDDNDPLALLCEQLN
jgi:hypothetical protein